MLIPENMQKIIRVLVNLDRSTTILEISKLSNSSLGGTSKIINQLIDAEYLLKSKGRIKLKSKKKLVKAWGYCVSINETINFDFICAEKPKYAMEKIKNLAQKNNLNYAFTLLSATEIFNPYVYPDKVDLYIKKEDFDTWKELLLKNNIYPSEKGNITLYLSKENVFFNSLNINNYYIVSPPQLYIDLFSKGGRYGEAAEKILEVIKNV
ncbi:hypothetical protein COV11_01090 [Candidatus Woesearchaeota archaeon CG10_big_fil_rev_8_21_14_0_10_30_7]|nr:MAG: hypothetical protein COV11_01090 [Candidatus Woesearchaeota archaeon CG10_big_fil_rev_8_21_14_0_10_30_7]